MFYKKFSELIQIKLMNVLRDTKKPRTFSATGLKRIDFFVINPLKQLPYRQLRNAVTFASLWKCGKTPLLRHKINSRN